MGKNIIIKLAILLVVSALVYSVYWFFKVGQVEKQVNKFISENAAHVSVGEVAISGFPLSQKITIKDLKFTIPNPVLNKRQVIVKHLEAKAGIFAADFSVTLVEPVSVQDIDNNSATVEFSKDPEITISFLDGRIAKLNYQDLGYRILDAEKNVIYAASSSVIVLESVAGEGDKIVTKITANVKDIEGFDVIDIYKNAFEKKVMEGIKTGEISIGSASDASIPLQPTDQPTAASPVTNVVPATALAVDQTQTVVDTTTTQPTATATNSADATNPEELTAAADKTVVKNNFMMDIEYAMTPIQGEQQAQIPTDPTQIQESPAQYSKVVKINSLEFSNPLYKIIVNGEANIFLDDNTPSGSIAVKVEKIDTLISYIATGFVQMVEQKKLPVAAEVQSTDLATNGLVAEDSYQVFLKRFADNLSPVAKELAAKNAVSKEEIAEFDVRREKNLEFLINETSIREILGKF